MDKRQGFWWAASLALLVVWVFLVTIMASEKGLSLPEWGILLVPAILTASHWLNRPGAGDTELQELTMEAKKARLRSEIASHQKD